MPVIDGPLGEHGAVLETLVGVDQVRGELLRKHQFAVPEAVRVFAQIDTGTRYSAVDGSVLEALDLRPVDTCLVRTPSTEEQPHEFSRFVVSLAVRASEGKLILASALVLRCHFLPEEGIKALIGQDLLAHCCFVYDGPASKFSLTF
jgi:hypothetical protein